MPTAHATTLSYALMCLSMSTKATASVASSLQEAAPTGSSNAQAEAMSNIESSKAKAGPHAGAALKLQGTEAAKVLQAVAA